MFLFCSTFLALLISLSRFPQQFCDSDVSHPPPILFLNAEVTLLKRPSEASPLFSERMGEINHDYSNHDYVGSDEVSLPRYNQPDIVQTGPYSLTCYFCNVFFTNPTSGISSGGQGQWPPHGDALQLPGKGNNLFWFPQCLNHADISCSKKFQQRFWINADHYTPSSTTPAVFFKFGDEGDASGLMDEHWTEYAEKYGALLVCLEHRFFGESFPNKDPHPDRTFLTTGQMMSDVILFVNWFKKTYPETAKQPWIAFGCSYPGYLAAWFMGQFPGFFKAAVASSAPVQVTFEFPEYFHVVSKVIQELYPECFQTIKSAFSCMENLAMSANPRPCHGYSNVNDMIKDFPNCPLQPDLTDPTTRSYFFLDSTSPFFDNEPAKRAKLYCPKLMSFKRKSKNPIVQYGLFLKSLNMTSAQCQSSSRFHWGDSERINLHHLLRRKTALQTRNADKDTDSWDWIVCHEVGFFMTSDPILGMFGKRSIGPEATFNCDNKFDMSMPQVRKNVQRTLQRYGGYNVPAKCTIFVNGNWDPWSTQGITDPSQTSPMNPVVFINGSQHCYSVGFEDTDNPNLYLVAAFDTISNDIGDLLRDPKCKFVIH